MQEQLNLQQQRCKILRLLLSRLTSAPHSQSTGKKWKQCNRKSNKFKQSRKVESDKEDKKGAGKPIGLRKKCEGYNFGRIRKQVMVQVRDSHRDIKDKNHME